MLGNTPRGLGKGGLVRRGRGEVEGEDPEPPAPDPQGINTRQVGGGEGRRGGGREG